MSARQGSSSKARERTLLFIRVTSIMRLCTALFGRSVGRALAFAINQMHKRVDDGCTHTHTHTHCTTFYSLKASNKEPPLTRRCSMIRLRLACSALLLLWHSSFSACCAHPLDRCCCCCCCCCVSPLPTRSQLPFLVDYIIILLIKLRRKKGSQAQTAVDTRGLDRRVTSY